jgi:hypothetical protein|tara:strand:- start:7 stop:552 length:546 start_codon:yes stop_codon:yes gene_type:complete
MDRRKAIKRISLSFGSMTVSTGLISIVQSCQSDDSLNNLKFFNTTQISFLDRVLEIILPETETPGAISLNLSKFVDAYVSKNIKSEDQKYLFALIDEFISMIVKSENVNSIDQVNDEIIEKYFSDHLDSGSMISMDGKNHSQICGLFREMAVNSYKLTEYVMTSKLGFVPIPGYYDGNVDV